MPAGCKAKHATNTRQRQFLERSRVTTSCVSYLLTYRPHTGGAALSSVSEVTRRPPGCMAGLLDVRAGWRDFTPARISGAFDFGNGPTEPDQPYRTRISRLLEKPHNRLDDRGDDADHAEDDGKDAKAAAALAGREGEEDPEGILGHRRSNREWTPMAANEENLLRDRRGLMTASFVKISVHSRLNLKTRQPLQARSRLLLLHGGEQDAQRPAGDPDFPDKAGQRATHQQQRHPERGHSDPLRGADHADHGNDAEQ